MQQDSQFTDDPAPGVRTVLVFDVSESVRISREDQHEIARRLDDLKKHVVREVLPARCGRLLKSTGDGLMLDFARPWEAVKTAFAIQEACKAVNAGVPPARHMRLRMGLDVGEVIVGEFDSYGDAVNLAHRITNKLAGPGEIVVSEAVRDQLAQFLDADMEDLDLGECHLKGVDVHAYRLGPPGPHPLIEPTPLSAPRIAVIPFRARITDSEHDKVLGEVLADDVIAALSRTRDGELLVISRLSTSVFRDRDEGAEAIGKHLRVSYVLSGSYDVSGDDLTLRVELADGFSGDAVWGNIFPGKVSGIVAGKDELIDLLVARVGEEILKRELKRARSEPLPTLKSYSLLMSAITFMHQGSSSAFDRAGEILEHLTEREALRQAAPHAWLAKWHVLRFNRGRSKDQQTEARIALDCTSRALYAEPDCSLAWTIDGFVHTNLLKRLDIGQERYERALSINPNESLAWLLKGTLHAFKGEGEQAVDGTERALRLSPMDPLRYFYESLAATAAHCAGNYERAIELAQRSLRSNRVHTSTLRSLAVAQSQLGRMEDARKTVAELLKLEPNLTIRSYLERHPSGAYETGKVWSDALHRAGVPY